MNKLLKNFSLNTINQIVILVIPLIITPYLTRTLGVDSLGISTYILSIATLFFSIGTLGTNIYSRREVAYTVAKKGNLKKVFYELFLVRLALTVLTLIVYFLFSFGRDYSVIYFIFSLTLSGNMLVVSWFFIGLEDMKRLVLRNCIIRVVSTIAIFILVNSPADLYLYVTIKGLSDFLAFVVMLPQVKKLIHHYEKAKLNLKKHFVPILKFFLPQAASLIYVQCDKIMIGSLTSNMSSVTIYEKGETLIKLPVTFVNALSAVTLPRIANLYAKDNTHNLNNLMKKISSYTLLFILPVVIGLGLVSRVFVPIYLGSDYANSSVVMVCLIPAVLAISLTSITCIQYLMPLDETSILTKSYFFAAIANVILNFVLIKYFDIIGAAIATDVAEILVFIIQYSYICKKYGSFKFSKDLVKRLVALFIMVSIVVVLGVGFGHALLGGVLQVILGGMSYILVVWLLKDSAFLELLIRLTKHNKQDLN